MDQQTVINLIKQYATVQGGTQGSFTVPLHWHRGPDAPQLFMGDLLLDSRGLNFPITDGNISFQIVSNGSTDQMILSGVSGMFIQTEIVTGGTSGSMATVITGGTTSIIIGEPSAPFTVGEPITGSISGSTGIFVGISNFVLNDTMIVLPPFGSIGNDLPIDLYFGQSPNYFYNIGMNARNKIDFLVGHDFTGSQLYTDYILNPGNMTILSNAAASGDAWFLRLPVNTSLPPNPQVGDVCFYSGHLQVCESAGVWTAL
jgi:hypothetical protein